MTVFTCAPDWEAMLTCIYTAWASGLGHQNIRLATEPVGQCSLFEEYVHVDADPDKALSVMRSVNTKLSPAIYQRMAYVGAAYEEDALDTIYRVMILAFAYGPDVLEMMQYKDVMRFFEIDRRVSREAHSFYEFLRFHEVRKCMYVAHFEPKSRIVTALGPHFADRMPSEHWMIIDDVHKEAIIHPKDEPWYFQKLRPEEFDRLLATEQENDVYSDLWKVFFESIAIEGRKNPKCQDNLFPKWKRKHAVEFL